MTVQLAAWDCRCPACADSGCVSFILFILLKEVDWFLCLLRASLLAEIFKQGTLDFGFQRAWNLGLPQTFWAWLSLPPGCVLCAVVFFLPPGYTLVVSTVMVKHIGQNYLDTFGIRYVLTMMLVMEMTRYPSFQHPQWAASSTEFLKVFSRFGHISDPGDGERTMPRSSPLSRVEA